MTREQVFDAGKYLIARLQRDYALMLDQVNGVAQSNHGFTSEDHKLHVQVALDQLDQISAQLTTEVALYRAALEKFRG